MGKSSLPLKEAVPKLLLQSHAYKGKDKGTIKLKGLFSELAYPIQSSESGKERIQFHHQRQN